eukprot:scaffold5664_cov115-Isochrysis_galbana.AAC.15
MVLRLWAGGMWARVLGLRGMWASGLRAGGGPRGRWTLSVGRRGPSWSNSPVRLGSVKGGLPCIGRSAAAQSAATVAGGWQGLWCLSVGGWVARPVVLEWVGVCIGTAPNQNT